jgi:nucleoid DNA-binding protein
VDGGQVKTKLDLDQSTAELTKVPIYVVKLVTGIWLEMLAKNLVDDGVVRLDSFGTLAVSTVPPRKRVLMPRWSFKSRKAMPPIVADVPTIVHVKFTKSDSLKKALKKRYSEGKSSGKPKRK